jgi:MYXO-CTERM domain-containing protein
MAFSMHNRSDDSRRRATPVLIVGLLIGLGGWQLPAGAGFLPEYTGWTEMYDCPVCDSTINFAVWQGEGGDGWGNDSAFNGLTLNGLTGGGSIDTASPFVYLYQVINTDNDRDRLNDLLPQELQDAGVPEEPLADFQILNRGSQQAFSSGGYLSAVFVDVAGKAVLGGANSTIADPDYAGDVYAGAGDTLPVDDPAPDAVPDPPRNQNPPSDHLPSAKGLVRIGLVEAEDNAFVAPDSVQLITGVDLTFFDGVDDALAVSFNWPLDDGFEPGTTSPVLFLTSKYEPGYDWGSTRSHNTASREDPQQNPWAGLPPLLFGANGDVPTAVPAPPTLALAALGLGLLLARVRRRD